jgi:hypothetical protein
MSRIALRPFLALFVVGLFGMPIACGSEFEPVSRVTDFRLIAVRADKPYAAPGERVELSTLSHEPFGRPITWAWTTCVAPRDTTVNACLAKIAEDAATSGAPPALTVGPMSTFATTIPANILDGVPPATRNNVLVGVITVACPGALTLKDIVGLPRGELPFRCVEAGSAEELPYDRYAVSVKRIYVRQVDRNQNPSLGAITWDGAPWAEDDVKEVVPCANSPINVFDDCSGGEKHEIAAWIPPEAVESGVSETGAPFTEDMVAQYYASEGLFEFGSRTRELPVTRWVARSVAAGKELTLWFVVRENRGGVSWTTRRVRVRQP